MTFRSKFALLLSMAAGLSVLGYNLWSYSCGHCTLKSLMTIGVPGYLLLSVNAGLALVLLALHHRGRQQLRRQLCCCGAMLVPTWQYCPTCGKENVR